MLIGGYEPNPTVRWTDGVPWDHGASPVQSDMDRFAPLLRGRDQTLSVPRPLRRDPAAVPPGRDDARRQPAAGSDARDPRFLGRRRSVAQRVRRCRRDRSRASRVDDRGRARARRRLAIARGASGAAYHDPWFATACAREAYRYYYRLRYPFDADEWGRGLRSSPLQVRLQELGAVFGTKNGWERRRSFRAGNRWRRSGADQRRFGWSKPPWFEPSRRGARGVPRARRDHRHDLVRQDRREWARRPPAARARLRQPHRSTDRQRDLHAVPQPPRRDRRRRDGDAARARSGSGSSPAPRRSTPIAAGSSWAPRREDGAVEIRDCSDELAVIGIWGPLRRGRCSPRAATTTSQTRRSRSADARHVDVGGATVLAQRITYVGELGYELYVPPAVGRAGVGPADGRRRRARHHARRLPRARVAAAREGLPLLRHRSHSRRTPRTRADSASALRSTRASSTAGLRSSRAGRSSRRGGCGR